MHDLALGLRVCLKLKAKLHVNYRYRETVPGGLVGEGISFKLEEGPLINHGVKISVEPQGRVAVDLGLVEVAEAGTRPVLLVVWMELLAGLLVASY